MICLVNVMKCSGKRKHESHSYITFHAAKPSLFSMRELFALASIDASGPCMQYAYDCSLMLMQVVYFACTVQL